MGVWLNGTGAILQGSVILLPWRRLRRYDRFGGIAAGITVGLVLFGWLQTALHQSNTAILACATVLGIVLGILLQECTPRHRELIWYGWTMLYALLQSKGTFESLSLPFLLSVYLALDSPRHPWLYIPLHLTGAVAGQFVPLPPKWQGLLLAIGCGILLQSIYGIERRTFAGGIAIGVILSFI